MPAPRGASHRSSHVTYKGKTEKTRKPRLPKRRVVPPPPGMTPDEAREKLASFTVDERRRLRAYCLNGTFKDAAAELDSDPHTISDTVYKMVGFIAVLIDEVEKTPVGGKKNPQASVH